MTIYTRDNGQWDPREAIGVNLSPTVQALLAADDAAGVRVAAGTLGVPTDFLTDNSGDYMVNDVVRYTDPAPTPTADLTGLYACITDHTSGSPKDYPARWKLVASQSRVAIGATAKLSDAGSYTYDGNGNVTAAPDGSTYSWESDGAGGYRVHTQTVGGVTRTFTYNTDGTIASVA